MYILPKIVEENFMNLGMSRSFQGYINPSRDNSWKSVSEFRILKEDKSLFQLNPNVLSDDSNDDIL